MLFSKPYPQYHPSEVGLDLDLQEGDSSAYTYDYIIVGGGTAGCCLASRLSEIQGASVLVVERGPILNTWPNRVPLISANFFRKDSPSVLFPSEPLAQANSRIVQVVSGEGLGGTSRINGCVYTRGLKGDWNRWKRPGWSYDDLLPYFVKSEKTLTQPTSPFRGKSGPWMNQVLPDIRFGILRRILEAGRAKGIPIINDINTPDSPAVASVALDLTIDQHRQRVSTFSAFLPKSLAISRRDTLKICTKTIVTRLRIGAEKHVEGVYMQAVDRDDKAYFARARREVILCAGAIASPQILLLSGIGPRSHLEEQGIDVVFDSPGVGTHLHDHYVLVTSYEVPKLESLTSLLQNPLRIVLELLKYLILGTGVLAYPFMQFTLFIRTALIGSNGGLDTSRAADVDGGNPDNTPDVEIMLCPHHSRQSPKVPAANTGVFSFLIALIRPRTTGSVRLASKDPRDRAKVELNYLSDLEDVKTLTSGVRFVESLADEVRRRGYPLGIIRNPSTASPDEFDAFLRANVQSAYHFTSTCRMAPLSDARPGVVDDELRVHGISGLCICDASVFTESLATHTMAPSVVVAEKLADMLKSQHTM